MPCIEHVVGGAGSMSGESWIFVAQRQAYDDNPAHKGLQPDNYTALGIIFYQPAFLGEPVIKPVRKATTPCRKPLCCDRVEFSVAREP
jgi:hypothetical protein